MAGCADGADIGLDCNQSLTSWVLRYLFRQCKRVAEISSAEIFIQRSPSRRTCLSLLIHCEGLID